MGILDLFFGKNPKNFRKCPNCGKLISLDEERCKYCGVRIKSMFKKKCPNCGYLNELDAKYCKKCKHSLEPITEEVYVCPVCGYEMKVYMTSCPVCGTKFI